MKVSRFSIGKMMIWVGIIALNLWIAGVLFAIDLVMLAWGTPAILILQFAVYRLIRDRGCARARAFWAGFCMAGSLATLSLVWGFAFHESVNIGIQQTAGGGITKIAVKQPGFPFADRAWAIWGGYGEIMMSYLERLPIPDFIVMERDVTLPVIVGIVVVLPPQLLIALTGGLLAWGLRRRATGIGAHKAPYGPCATQP